MRSWDLDIYLDFFFVVSFAIFQYNPVCSGFQQEKNGISKGEDNWIEFKKRLFLNVWKELRKPRRNGTAPQD